MFIQFKSNTGSRLFLSAGDNDDSVRIEEYSGTGDSTRYIWGRTLTAEQATEVKNFLIAKGF